MSSVGEALRGVTALGRLFAGLPVLALRTARATGRDARPLAVAHAARARRRAHIEIEVDGAENVPKSGPFVLVYNQTSIADDFGNPEVFARVGVTRSVLAAEYGAIPFVGRAAARWGLVLLRRHHRDAVDRVLADLVAALRSGERVSIAPEGHYSPDGQVGHFKRGGLLLAIRAGGVPVVPMAVRGGRDIVRPGSLRWHPGSLRYRIGQPIATEGFTEEDAPALAAAARSAVAALYDAAAIS